MIHFDSIEISCPYCSEINVLNIELEKASSDVIISDCGVCCRAFEVIIRTDPDGNLNVEVKNEEGF
ncbi:MAG: CPXCG motif-containing cysteine-rich protein [Bacteroidetes bacterium]|nr:CPXCG motif-containing cysteine-rich protein [Bacteroidota bacterium]